jgi:hypothetical protein
MIVAAAFNRFISISIRDNYAWEHTQNLYKDYQKVAAATSTRPVAKGPAWLTSERDTNKLPSTKLS